MDDRRPDSDLTFFKAAQERLRAKLAAATIEPVEFRRPIRRCSLSGCRGMCCYDGASVDDATAELVQNLAETRREDFAAMGLDLPCAVVEGNEWQGVKGQKTATRPFPYRSLVGDYPAHFNETACVFLLEDGRCGLQQLSVQDGRHPWYYKPFTCWLQPIKLAEAAVRLYGEDTDPNKFPGYDGFVVRTHCGRSEPCGQPAADVLHDELGFLGRLVGRHFATEAKGVPRPNK